MGGIATAVLGHCHPKVMAAADQQLRTLWHASNLYTTGPQVALAEKLAQLSFADQFFFCNSGAEANEAALKLARRFARDRGEDRFEFVAFDGAFHGRTLFTLSATGTPAYWKGFEPLVPGFHHVPYGDLTATAGALSSQTAAIIVEPVKGENGVRPAPAGFLVGLRELADQNGCLLIMDEVQTGMGRTGPLFAHQASGIEPDIMTLAKALANGLPMGAMGARESVAASLTPGTHGSTFGGNPIAAAAACAVLDELTEGGVLEEAEKIGRYLGDELQAIAERLGPEKVVEARGSGHLQALELTGKAAPVIDRCRGKRRARDFGGRKCAPPGSSADTHARRSPGRPRDHREGRLRELATLPIGLALLRKGARTLNEVFAPSHRGDQVISLRHGVGDAPVLESLHGRLLACANRKRRTLGNLIGPASYRLHQLAPPVRLR